MFQCITSPISRDRPPFCRRTPPSVPEDLRSRWSDRRSPIRHNGAYMTSFAIKISGEPDEVMMMGIVRDITHLIADERGLAIGLLVLIALLVALGFLKSE